MNNSKLTPFILGCCGYLWSECHRSSLLLYDSEGTSDLPALPPARPSQDPGVCEASEGDDSDTGGPGEIAG